MISTQDLNSLVGRTVHGTDGQKIGKVVDVYESTDGPEATFATVSTGLFGGHATFVPLAQASLQGDDVVVPYDKDLVQDAPRVAADEELTADEEARLYSHYGLSGGAGAATTTGTTTGTTTTGTTATAGTATTGRPAAETAVPRGTSREDIDGDGVFDDVEDTAVGRDTSGLTTDDAMTRSEERLSVGTERVQAGRARLRKRVVTDTETRTVPVSHDEVRVTREPITDATMPQAMDGPAISEEEHEVVLQKEVPVVAKEAVPVERVRLDTETVTEQQTVSEQVRKEQIEPDVPPSTSR